MDQLLNETIDTFNEYIQKVPTGSTVIAELLREDRIIEALNNIKNFTEGTLWLVDANELFKQNNVNSDLDISKINEYLIEINEGLALQDYSLVADLFEYEIAPFFEETQNVMISDKS
ncbi:MAG: hypothetical protein ABS938_04875 [Psychrobacillus psychrodurans]